MIAQFQIYFTGALRYPITIALFRKCIYLVMLYILIAMTLPLMNWYWGPDSLIPNHNVNIQGVYDMLYFFNDPIFDNWYLPLIILHIIFLFIGLAGKYSRLTHVLIFLTTAWLYNRLYFYIIGGNHLLLILLFYLCFIQEKEELPAKTWGSAFDIVAGNLFFWAARIHVCWVYLFSGFYKIGGEDWLQGDAMFYLLNIPEYSHSYLPDFITSSIWLLGGMTWLAVIYQFAFPILVWWKTTKIPLLIVGIMFHLFIGLVVGIFDFSLIMIAAYTLFLSESQSIKLLSKLSGLGKKLLMLKR